MYVQRSDNNPRYCPLPLTLLGIESLVGSALTRLAGLGASRDSQSLPSVSLKEHWD